MGGACSSYAYPLSPSSKFLSLKKNSASGAGYAAYRAPDGKLAEIYLEDGENLESLQNRVRAGKVFYDAAGQSVNSSMVSYHSASGKYVEGKQHCKADQLVNRFLMGACSLCLLLLCAAAVFGATQYGLGACLLSFLSAWCWWLPASSPA